MLKTNSKKLIEKVNNYIIDNFNYESYFDNKYLKLNCKTLEGAPLEEIKKTILKILIIEKLTNYNYSILETLKRFYKNSFLEVFKDWAQGLPGAFDTCYYYSASAVELVGEWLEETEEEKARFNEQQAEDLASYLIFTELTRNININDLIKEF